ncbi:tetratricopeptide repeat protein [Dokdonella sp.]|uniref:tetratricopeptide repeat protein n=1 Tax=Dokdonella sp. TaxID=2291710 RepID=UPI001B12C957|nr:tetratricopeptide repeat protein [Dokdonella sp.]MBO9662607.1 tetratricopeptide repeat protein [Dokdonella sp.]
MYADTLEERIEAILDLDDVDNSGYALGLAERLVAELPREPRALAVRARARYKCHKEDAARADVEAALALDPQCVDALWARTLLIDDDDESANVRALAELDRLLARQPDHYGCHLSRGWRFHQLGRLDDAVAACEAALRARPHRRRPAVNAATFLQEAGRAEEASAFYERTAAASPDDGMTAYNAGTHYYQLGQYDKAIVHLDRGRRLLGEQNAIQHNRALTLQALGRHAEAIEEWSNVLLREPDWDWAVSGRFRSLRALGRNAEADADHARWMEIVGPDSSEALQAEPRRLIEAGEHASALRLLEKAIAAGQVDLDLFNLAGFCLARLDRHAQAKTMYERALALDDGCAYVHRNYGEALLGLDDPAGAQAHAETAVALDPRDDRAHRLRGLALVKLGHTADAVPSFEQWVALAPGSVAALVQLIKALQSLGRHAEALTRCDELIRLIPADGWGHMKKGESYEALGSVANAKMAYQKAASSYLAAGENGDAEHCRKAAENAGNEKKRGLFGRLFGKG